MSVKFQVTLPDDLAIELKTAAAKRKLPLAEFIRETMQQKLREAKKAGPSKDLFSSITGILDCPDTDLSSRVDEILYGRDPHT